MGCDELRPILQIPRGLCPEQETRVIRRIAKDRFEPSLGAKITYLLTGSSRFRFEFGNDRGQTIVLTNRRSNDDPRPVCRDESDNGVIFRGKPTLDAGIYDLKGGRIPPKGEDQRSSLFDSLRVRSLSEFRHQMKA